jgi:hypothetical protein
MNHLNLFRLFFLFLLTMFFSCNQKKKIKPTGFTERKIDLDSGIGIISINLPARLNNYIHWSDKYNEPFLGRLYYRFFDNNYSHEKYGTNVSDSIYQLTIWQTDLPQNPINRRPCFSKMDSLEILGKPHQVTDNYTKYILREFRLINNKLFSVQVMESTSLPSHRTTLYVVGTTCLKDKRLQFVAQCRGQDTTSFFDNMYKTMLSIQITEKQ